MGKINKPLIIENELKDKEYILEGVFQRFERQNTGGRIYNWPWWRKYNRIMKIKSIFNEKLG